MDFRRYVKNRRTSLQRDELIRVKIVTDTNVFGTIAMIKSYNTSKTGASEFRKAIQNDLAQNNIKITDVCPGLIQTEFYKRANNELPENIMNTGLTPENVANIVKFVFDLPHEITIPSIEARNIKNY